MAVLQDLCAIGRILLKFCNWWERRASATLEKYSDPPVELGTGVISWYNGGVLVAVFAADPKLCIRGRY